MNNKNIQINDVIIDSGYITTIDFHAIILPSDGCKHQSGEGDGDNDGPKIIKCTGCRIAVLEDEIEGGWRGDLWFCVICRGDNDAPEKCQECHEPIEVAANERFCSHKCGMAWQKFLAELPF